MIGDHKTKPLQGAMFREFREKIMGVIPDTYPGPRKVKVEKLRKDPVSMISTIHQKMMAPQACVGRN